MALLPAVLAGILVWRRKPGQRPALWSTFRPVWPYWLIAAVLTAVNLWFQKHGTEVVIRPIGILERSLGAGAVIWFYLQKSLFPAHLGFVYPQWHIRPQNPLWWLPVLAGAVVAALAALTWRQCETFHDARALRRLQLRSGNPRSGAIRRALSGSPAGGWFRFGTV